MDYFDDAKLQLIFDLYKYIYTNFICYITYFFNTLDKRLKNKIKSGPR